MSHVFKKQSTDDVPESAKVFTKNGKRFARWVTAKGLTKTEQVIVGRSGKDRVATWTETYFAKYREASGVVRVKSTGCCSKDMALRVLAEWERREELIRAGVMTAAESQGSRFQQIPLSRHFEGYVEYLRARSTSPVRIANMSSQFSRICRDCGFHKLNDLDAERLVQWLNQQEDSGMSAAARNGYRETCVMFANWCGRSSPQRLTANPFKHVPKANAKSDPRRKRRAFTEVEIQQLLTVAQLHPLAEFGRQSTPKPLAEVKKKRDT